MTDTPTPRPHAASRFATLETDLATARRALAHIPHPHLARRRAAGPVRVADQLPTGSPAARFNTRIALLITRAVGSMWCAYLFAAFDLLSLPAAVRAGTATVVSWVAQTFLQLVLLSVIMVGQNVQAAAADARARATFDDGEAILHYADGHAKNITQLRAELEQGLAHVHTKLDTMHKTVLAAVAHPILVQSAAQEPAASAPASSTPPGPPTAPPAAAAPATAAPSSPPADGPTGTASTS